MCRTNRSYCSKPYVSGSAGTHRRTNSVTLCYSCTLHKRLRAENVTHLHRQLFSFRDNKRNLARRVDSSVTALYFRLSVWWIIISSVGFSSQADLASRPLTCLRFIHQSNSLGLTAHSRPQDTKVTGKIRLTCSPPMISLIPANMHSLCGTVTSSDWRSEHRLVSFVIFIVCGFHSPLEVSCCHAKGLYFFDLLVLLSPCGLKWSTVSVM